MSVESGKNPRRKCSCGCNRLVTRSTAWRHKKTLPSLLIAKLESPPPPGRRRIAHFEAADSIDDFWNGEDVAMEGDVDVLEGISSDWAIAKPARKAASARQGTRGKENCNPATVAHASVPSSIYSTGPQRAAPVTIPVEEILSAELAVVRGKYF
jgi:hypothetical protein